MQLLLLIFKTGSSDIIAPELMYANGDDYSVAVTFSEPMNIAKQTDTTKWPYSVLNPANYYINGIEEQVSSWGDAVTLVDYTGVGGTSLSGLGMSFSYDDYSNTVYIDGFAFSANSASFQITSIMFGIGPIMKLPIPVTGPGTAHIGMLPGHLCMIALTPMEIWVPGQWIIIWIWATWA
jgi:hypothetical protein